MATNSQLKTAQHLIRLITTRNGKIPNFALLLGAGASQYSRVDTATDMIEDWHRLMFNAYGDGEFQGWLNRQPWYRHDDEYSILFESIFDQPSQRRVFIEENLRGARPNWGYVYLTGLLQHRFFDVVFTTNFDDLINEACYVYSEELRPIVAAHDSAIQGIRVTSGRPKIIKLHGDFLYDNIKNTLAELETLETNTKRKLHQFAQEYGLVVVGYSGRDRSVMDTLDVLLRDDDNYKQGVYWCLLPGEEPSNRLQSLCRRDRVYLVEIAGFDEFFADLYQETGEALPTAIARPFEMARERVDLFVSANAKLDSHPIIAEHKDLLLRSIADDTPELPIPLQAAFAASIGYTDEALRLWKKATYDDPDDTHLATRYANILLDEEKTDELLAYIEKSPLDGDDRAYFLLRAEQNDEVIALATKLLDSVDGISDGIPVGEEPIVLINRAIALKRIGKLEEMDADLTQLEQSGAVDEHANIRAGVAALRGDKDAMFKALDECLFKTISPRQLTMFPVFEDYREDSDFKSFTRSAERRGRAVDRRRRRLYDGYHEEE